MTVHQPAALFEESGDTEPRRNRGERTFDLHPAIHVATVGAYTAFVGILIAAFAGPDLLVPATIILLSVAALFATPGLWARVQPANDLPKQSWRDFLQEGVECLTGRLSASAALAQILVLPGLMVCLALGFAIIRATV